MKERQYLRHDKLQKGHFLTSSIVLASSPSSLHQCYYYESITLLYNQVTLAKIDGPSGGPLIQPLSQNNNSFFQDLWTQNFKRFKAVSQVIESRKIEELLSPKPLESMWRKQQVCVDSKRNNANMHSGKDFTPRSSSLGQRCLSELLLPENRSHTIPLLVSKIISERKFQ